MGSADKPHGDDLVAGLRREIEGLKKQLEHHKTLVHLRNNALADVSKAIFRLDTFETTAEFIFQACKRATGARSGYVALLTSDGKENSVLYLDAGGMPCSVDPELPMPIRGLRAEAYRTKQPVYDNDFKGSEWVRLMPAGHVALKNVMFAPMVIGDEAKGLIGLANKPGGFTDEDAEIAMSYSRIAAIALQSSRMIESIKDTNRKLQESYQDASLLKDLLVHDINNVFQAISGAAELWKAKIAKGSPATGMVESIGLILDNIARGAALIASIQKLEKLENPKLDLVRRDIMPPLKEAIAIVNKRFFSKQIEVSIDAEEEEMFVIATDLVRDAFENILRNSVRHNTNPTIKIGIAVRHADGAESPAVRLEFTDNGIGIEDGRKGTIFDRKASKSHSKEGLGIGLSVVKRIIAKCGGKIWVEDAVKGDHTRGSKFIVMLPSGAYGATSGH